MSDHKTYCNCSRCTDAKRFESAGKPKRFLPKFVMESIKQKSAEKEEMMLWKGFILFECPSCKHRAYTKITPTMKCVCCCAEFK